MPDRRNEELVRELRRFIGETVTIFTTSGGESGEGFTGVLMGVNCRFVRLLAVIGPGPACALGNTCEDEDRHHRRHRRDENFEEDFEDNNDNFEDEMMGRRRRNRRRNFGSVVDIPVNRIAAFVHNAV